MPTTATRTSSFFDSYARDFDAIYGNKKGAVNGLVNTLFRKAMKVRYLKTIEGCNPIDGMSVLDVGSGPGHYSVELAKRGAKEVLGIDFADGMLEVARGRAAQEGVAAKCRFEKLDFINHAFNRKFDYLILMGFMDYMEDPAFVVKKAVSLTSGRCFFSFPLDEGFLAWQRKLRYKTRCDLYMYPESKVRGLFAGVGAKKVDFTRIGRDLFVTVDVR